MTKITNIAPANLLTQAIDTTAIGTSCVRDLGALFEAIRGATDKDSHAHRLATIGLNLSDNWTNMLECEKEDLERRQQQG